MKKTAIFPLLFFCLALSGCGGEHLTAKTPVAFSFEEVSVHDPAVIDGEDGYYYIFGSHLAAAKSTDLMNWSYVNQGVKNENSVIPDVLKQMKDAFEWSHSNTFWAPDPVRLRSGKYAMYYCNCKGDEPLSCLGLATADAVAGPYTNQGILLKSGMSADVPDEDGDLYQATQDPNAVDPVAFYSPDGRLWMIYGSYSGGIFVKEMDPDTGLPLQPGYGKKLLGGNHLRIEAPYVIYNPDTGFYYLFLSFGGLDSDGGYNVRVCRSETPDGPYYDSMGNKMTSCKGPSGSVFSDVTAERFGTKLMGGYKFLCEDGESGEGRRGYLSPGHNSCLYEEETGKYFILYHTRFENSGEEHQVRVHQMFFNEDGWPVIAPYRYTGETLAACGDEEIVGRWKWLDHGRDISAEMHESSVVTLEKSGKITGAVSGTWSRSGENGIVLEADGRTYRGVLLRQWDEDGQKYVMTFTALCPETGVSVWGSGINALE
ncbi:MAG: glycoside hydrolase family 43 protein [Oscillospiraceae bacterium]|nr:glycoside hydrolase family 43 protein [Oscillospiraceae bacterium]